MNVHPDTGLEDTRSIVSIVRACIEDSRERFREFHDFIGENLSFALDGEHYDDDASFQTRSLNKIRPRDPSIFRVWAYTLSLFLQRFPVHIEARPNRFSMGAQPEELEGVKRSVSAWVEDPDNDYDYVREQVVGGALCGAAWAAELCYSRSQGLTVAGLDPRMMGWAAGYPHPHAKGNPWVVTWKRVPEAEVRRLYGKRVPEWLRGDDGVSVNRSGQNGSAERPNLASGGQSPQEQPGENALVTLAYMRMRYQPVKKRRGEPADLQLDPRMHYMACAECDYKSPPQAESMDTYAESGTCPECGGMTGLVTHVPGNKYQSGKRLVVCAPFSGHDEPFYDDNWEFDYSTFPVLWWTAFVFPHKPIPQSRTSILRTPTLITDAMYVIAYQTLLRSRPYYAMPDEGVNNYLGQMFGFGDADGDVMYYDRTSFANNPVEVVQGQAFNPQVLAILDRQHALIRENEDTSQTTLSPDQLARVKVGAVEAQQETGNVTLDRQGRRFYVSESRFVSCIAQALRELPPRDERYRDEKGEWRFQTVGGAGSPNADIIVGSGYGMDQLSEEDIKAYMMLRQMAPEDRRAFVAIKHLDASILAQVERADAEAADRMAAEAERQRVAVAMQGFNRFMGNGAPAVAPNGAAPGMPRNMNGTVR